MTRKWILAASVVLILFAGGCDLLDSNSLTQDQIVAVTNYTDNLNANLKIYQKMANEMAAVLEVGGVIDVNDLIKLAKINDEINRITPQITAISAAVREGQYSGADPYIINLLKAAKAGNIASTSFNPYAAIIDGGLTLALIIVGWFAKRKNDQAKEEAARADLSTNALKNVVTAVEVSSENTSSEIKAKVVNSKEEKALITALKPEIVERLVTTS